MAVALGCGAACGDGRTIGARHVKIADDLIEVYFVDQRSDFGIGIKGVTHADVVHAFDQLGLELLAHALLDQEARR